MKKVLSIILVLLLMAGSFSSLSYAQSLKVTVDYLNVRDDVWGDVIGTIEENQTFEILDTEQDNDGKDWYKIRYNSTNGWVHSDYVSLGSSSPQYGWEKEGGYWVYYSDSGNKAKNGWMSIAGEWYYFDSKGRMQSNKWVGDYYVGSSGAMLRSTRTPDGYYVDSNGKWISGATSLGTLQVTEDYLRVRSSNSTSSTVYGYIMTGDTYKYYKVSGNWAMIRYDGKDAWIYTTYVNLNPTTQNTVSYGWKKEGSNWVYYSDSGNKVKSAWKRISSKWYYFNSQGIMQYSKWIGDYYVGSSGAMLYSTRTPDGYYVDSNGKWLKGATSLGTLQVTEDYLRVRSSNSLSSDVYGYTMNGDSYHYYKVSGNWAMIRYDGKDAWIYISYVRMKPYTQSSVTTNYGWRKEGSNWVYYSDSGNKVKSAWKRISSKWYYFNSQGIMQHSKWIGRYYLGSSGAMLYNTRTPDGYYVDSNGEWLEGATSLGTLQVTEDYLRVRASNSLSSEVYGHTMKGDRFSYHKVSGNWAVIRFGGKDAWIYTYYTNMYPKTQNNINGNYGWKNENGYWVYYLDSGDKVKDAWRHIDSEWYVFDREGKMQRNKWVDNYYVGSSGAMLYNTRTPDGYYVDSNGEWLEGATSLGFLIVREDDLRIRSSHSTDSEIYGYAQKGDRYDYHSINGSWALIKYEGQDAWINTTYVSRYSASSNIDSVETPTLYFSSTHYDGEDPIIISILSDADYIYESQLYIDSGNGYELVKDYDDKNYYVWELDSSGTYRFKTNVRLIVNNDAYASTEITANFSEGAYDSSYSAYGTSGWKTVDYPRLAKEIDPLNILSTRHDLPVPIEQRLIVKDSGLYFRSGPSTDSSILDVLSKGDQLQYISKSGEWYKVKYYSEVGYVHGDYVIEGDSVKEFVDTVPRELLEELGYNDGVLTNKFMKDLKHTLDKYLISRDLDIETNNNRITHFLTQITHESGRGRYNIEEVTIEYMLATYGEPGDKYSTMGDVVNEETGLRRYNGAGYIQLSTRGNYEGFAESEGDPDILDKGVYYVAQKYPWLSAGWWWLNNGMNYFIDEGASATDVSIRVNGGTNGLSDRLELFDEIMTFIGK